MDILLSGANGSMGRVIIDLARERETFNIIAGIGRTSGAGDIPVYENFRDVEEEVDIVLDFSSHENLKALLKFSLDRRLPLVIATTGYDEDDMATIYEASKKIPILFSRNMSIGINLILGLVEELASGLKGFDIEIVEKHHRLKADSPSGTGLMLFDAVNKGREKSLYPNLTRNGRDLTRQDGEVGIHGIRAGTIVGEHQVIFAGLDEVIEIKHSAQSKNIFGQGGLMACEFLLGKEPGMYSMEDIFKK